VDREGNQLPYLGEITMNEVANLEVLALQASSGEYDFQDRHLAVAQLPVLIDNQERGGYTTHRAPGENMDFVVRINLAYDADPVLGELIRNVDFRRALSLAVDRDQVNEAFFLGTSIPGATMAAETSPYFPGEEWRTRWAVLDVEQANELLDGIGLTDKDGSGLRIRPDGNGPIRLDYQAVAGLADCTGIGEMIGRHWAEIGIEMTAQQVEGTLLSERIEANDMMLTGHGGGAEDVFLLNEAFLPTSTRGLAGSIGAPYVRWFNSGGQQGVEPPPALDALKEAMDLLGQGFRASEEERIEIGKRIHELHADQVWTIGVCGFGLSSYGLYLASDRLKNVPARVLNSSLQKTTVNTMPITFTY
ncbi:MAG: ABC transporter substrate-binding protein, partial [Acidimicrobiia bacterium]